MDNTKEVVHAINPKINYVWIPEGNKSFALWYVSASLSVDVLCRALIRGCCLGLQVGGHALRLSPRQGWCVQALQVHHAD